MPPADRRLRALMVEDNSIDVVAGKAPKILRNYFFPDLRRA